MNIRHELDQKIIGYRQKLTSLDLLLDDEMAKPLTRRNRMLLLFLDKERSVYGFALSEMELLHHQIAANSNE
jgi:hypothetical protein